MNAGVLYEHRPTCCSRFSERLKQTSTIQLTSISRLNHSVAENKNRFIKIK